MSRPDEAADGAADDAGPVARSVVVRGVVQGVGFRWSCREAAAEAGVSGWVANAADGSVHAVLEGPPEAVGSLLGWLRHGPRHAEVDDVTVDEVPVEGRSGFTIR